MISAPDLEFKDGLIRTQSKSSDSKSVTSFTFDFSPAFGRIRRLIPLSRYQHLSALSLSGHGFSDISSLSNMNQLVKLNLSYNSISDIESLTKLNSLEVLNLSHNKITSISPKFENLLNLKSLNLSFNRITDRTAIQNLKKNSHLQTLQLDGNAFMNDNGSLSFVIFHLPQITFLNQQRIQQDKKVQASKDFSNTTSQSIDDDEYVERRPYNILLQESQNRQINMINKINDSEIQQSNLKSNIDLLKAEVALSKTINMKKDNSDELLELKVKLKKTKQKLHLARQDKVKAEEELELEKTLLLKQRQMYDRLNERYQNERRSKEPKQMIKSSPKPIPKVAEIRYPTVVNENKRLQQIIESMKETEAFHMQEIASQRKQIENLIAQQNNFLQNPNNSGVINDKNSLQLEEKETLISNLSLKIEELQEENEHKKQEILDQMSTIHQLQEKTSLSNQHYQLSFNSQIETFQLQIQQKDEALLTAKNEIQKLSMENDQIKMHNKILEASKEELTKQIEKAQSKISQFENEKALQTGNIKQIQDYADEIVKLNESSTEQKFQLKYQINQLKQDLLLSNDQLKQTKENNIEISKQIEQLKNHIDLISDESEKKLKQAQREKEAFVSKITMEIRARDEKIQSLTKLFKDSFHLDTISIENLSASGLFNQIQKENDERDVRIAEYEKIINELRQNLDITKQKLDKVETENVTLKEKAQNSFNDKEEIQEQAQLIIQKLEKKIKKQKKQILQLTEILQTNHNNQEQSDKEDQTKRQLLIEKESKIAELSNKLSIQSKESESKISLLTENNTKLQSKVSEVQQLQFSLLTHIQNIMNQFESSSQHQINEINQSTLIHISQFFMNLQVEYTNMKDLYEKAKAKMQDQKRELMKFEESANSTRKQFDRLTTEKNETEAKYKTLLNENSQLKSSIQESQSQVHDLSLQLSQLENSSQASDISSINGNYYPDEIKRLKKTKHQIKQEKLSLEQQVKSLNKLNFEKTTEIDQLKASLQNSELYRSEISNTIELVEQRSQVKISELQKEIAETESMLSASKSREEISRNEIERISNENSMLIEKLKRAQRKLDHQKTLTKQLELEISQQKEVSETLSASKDQKNDQNLTIIDNLRDQLTEKTHQADTQSIDHLNEKHQLEMERQIAEKNAEKLNKKVSHLSNLVQEFDTETQKANDTIISLRQEIKELNEQLHQKEVDIVRATDIRDTTEHLFKALTNKYNDLRKEYDEYKFTVESKQEQLQFIKQIEALKKENKKLNKDLSQLKNHEKSFNDLHSEQSAKIAKLEDQINDLNSQKKNSDLVIERYSSKINELQKTIQILQSQIDEHSHLTNSLTSKIIETKESMIEKPQFEEMQQRCLNLSMKKKNLKQQLQESLKEIENLKKNTELAETKSQFQEEKMNDMKKNLDAKIKELQEIIDTKDAELQDFDQIKESMEVEIQKLNDQIAKISKEKEEHEIVMNQTSDKFASETQNQNEKMAELETQNKDYQQKIDEQNSLISELKEKVEENEKQINENQNKYEQEIGELDKVKSDLEEKNESLIKELSRAKIDLRNIQEEKQQFNNYLAEKQDTIQELSTKLAGTVPAEDFNNLKVKYETNKKLLKFNEGKLQSESYERSMAIEKLNKEFEDKEDKYNQQIRSLNKEIESNKDLIRKLRFELQSLTRKLEVYSTPGAELIPASQLTIAEEQIKNKDTEIEQLTAKIEELNSQNETFDKKVNELQSTIRKNDTKIEEINHSNEFLQKEKESLDDNFKKLVELTKSVNNSFIQSGRILHSSNIAEKLNNLFQFAKLNAIAFYSPQLSFKKFEIMNLDESISKTIERERSIVNNIKVILTNFPLESKFSTAKDIEGDLIQIRDFVSKLKTSFDEQMKHIEEANQIISTQHNTILQNENT